MKLAIVIPTYSVRPALIDMEIRNAKIWKEQCDDLIITEDGGFVPELAAIADLYLTHENLGVCANMRLGWQVALLRGAEYVALMDSDVTLVAGNMKEDFCAPGRVTVPTVNQYPDTAFTAPMLCVPKTVSDERGIYEDCKTHRNEHFDAVYYQKIFDLIQKSREVRVDHIGGATRFNNV